MFVEPGGTDTAPDGTSSDGISPMDATADGSEDVGEAGDVDETPEVSAADAEPAPTDADAPPPEPPDPDATQALDASDASGSIVVADGGPGPIFGTPDADADVEPPSPDAAPPEPDAAPVEPDVVEEEDASAPPDVEEPVIPTSPCAPNPCQQPAAHTCSGSKAQTSFVPGACTIVGGAAVCNYAYQAMDCAQAGGSCVGGFCQGSPASPAEGELVLVEVMRNPIPNTRQWLEVLVTAGAERNLAGCGIADGAGNVHVLSPAPILVQPGDFVLLAEASPTTDGVPTPDATLAVQALDLLADAGPLVINCMGAHVDSVDYTGEDPLYPFPAVQGVSMQVGPGNYSAEANDDSKRWCSSPDPYTFGGYGSPGEANPSCNADVDKCALWSPAIGVGKVGEPLEATAVVFDEGITNVTINAPDPTNELTGQLGLGPDGVNPEIFPGDFLWVDGVPDYSPPAGVAPTEDVYGAWIVPEAAGQFDLAARFTPDGGNTWLYCDLDGSNNGYQVDKAGHVLVSP